MRLGTSTCLYASKRNGGFYPLDESMMHCFKHGYKVQDANFCNVADCLSRDDWQQHIEGIRERAEKHGIEFVQSHIPYYNVLDIRFRDDEFKIEMVRRGIIASAMLGVKWAVMHPGTDIQQNCEREASLLGNLEYFLPRVELAMSLNLGIAIENMADFPGNPIVRRFAATPEDLCDLVDRFNDPRVGICWDFGHGNLMKYDQQRCLRMIGKRLKATHVNDNRGKGDDHVTPFYGDVQWEELLPVLKEIEYTGDFMYEIHGQTNRLPAQMRDAEVAHSYEIGMYLLNLAG